MDDKITFKDYLLSKERLREAVAKVPQRSALYTVKKYCKLTIGESKNARDYVNLKPNHQIQVEWLYNDIDNPKVMSVKFVGVTGILDESEHQVFWEGARLLKWLSKNTREDF